MTQPNKLTMAKRGSVVLVGAGPGDPDLLTIKALKALKSADVILYDALVSAEVLGLARRTAKRLLVGKTGYGPSCRQEEINAMMLALAKAGRRVVRLKAGDPLIFGRAGEEIAALEVAGIPVSVVPGISSAQGAAAALGISLTHRDNAQRLQLVTGHRKSGRLPDDLDWAALADPRATTVVYMPKHTLATLAGRLAEHGLPVSTPAAAVFDATRGSERVILDTLAGIAARVAADASGSPCIVLIGEVLRARLEASAGSELLQRQFSIAGV